MKFMLLIHGNEEAMNNATKVNATGMSPEYAAYNEALIKAGAMLAGERLRPTTTAASVRVRNGKTEVLDGPYAETKEQFGGYYIIEAADFDTAMGWAQKCPAANFGTIEVRPVIQG
ncbi:YciI family protein [Devosia sp.]|uniref:YciI family protein n=1 Tax=Devosia sp. TaxID=1871048 RepID=UPI002FC80F0A